MAMTMAAGKIALGISAHWHCNGFAPELLLKPALFAPSLATGDSWHATIAMWGMPKNSVAESFVHWHNKHGSAK
jgi:hypothetical protein